MYLKVLANDSSIIFFASDYIIYYLNNVAVLYHEVEIHLELETSTLITEGETICFSSMSLNSNRPTQHSGHLPQFMGRKSQFNKNFGGFFF